MKTCREKAILIVSFGTTRDEIRKRTMDVLEAEVRGWYPEYEVRQAFTSQMVIKRLAARGIRIPHVTEALERLCQDGVKQVIVLATHLLHGGEYEKILAGAESYKTSGMKVLVTKPLLSDETDLKRAADAIRKAYVTEEGEALLLMGHGAPGESHQAYAALAEQCRSVGAEHIYVAVVNGEPQVEEVLPRIREDGYQKLALAPLMLVAGEHAQQEMAGDEPDSWKSQGIRAGFLVRCLLTGLGELAEIREIYREHLNRCSGK